MQPSAPPAGLCDRCAHQQVVRTTRGSRFSLCLRSRTDPAYPRYPRVPVVRCAGYEQRMSTSTTFSIGDRVPAFSLPDTDGASHAVPLDPAPPGTVIIVTCNHCPYVVAWNPRLRAVAEDYAPRGVRFLQLNANDPERYPADSPQRMAQFVRDQEWPIPYLFDADQSVAAALGAEVTPHVFVLDSGHRLRYRGAPDADHRDPGQRATWLRAALDAVLAGEEVAEPRTRARGCSVKWRA